MLDIMMVYKVLIMDNNRHENKIHNFENGMIFNQILLVLLLKIKEIINFKLAKTKLWWLTKSGRETKFTNNANYPITRKQWLIWIITGVTKRYSIDRAKMIACKIMTHNIDDEKQVVNLMIKVSSWKNDLLRSMGLWSL